MTMLDPNMTLLYTALEAVTAQLEEDSAADAPWAAARGALAQYGVTEEDDLELAAAVEMKDAETLTGIMGEWASGKRVMLEHDRGVLKRAMKAYRKSLKVTLLDAESSLGGGPMSSGRRSTICGITPPRRYPREVWDFLVHQDRLIAGDRGTYELPPGG